MENENIRAEKLENINKAEHGKLKQMWDDAHDAVKPCLKLKCPYKAIKSHWVQESLLRTISDKKTILFSILHMVLSIIMDLTRRVQQKVL